MNLIHITEEAHKALVNAAPDPANVSGSKHAHNGGYFINIDDECRDMLDAHGPDYSATIIKVCS